MRESSQTKRVFTRTLFSISIVALALAGTACSRGAIELDSTPAEMSGMSPQHGKSGGGDNCTITVESFDLMGTITIKFGNAQAQDVDVVDEVTLSCTVPAHAAGTVDVTVWNGFGEMVILENAFTYHNAPQAQVLDPARGPLAGGTEVTVDGQDFTGVSELSVLFNGVEASDVEFVDETTITCTVPAGAEGAVDVLVTNEFGANSLSEGYTYYVPAEINNLDPDEANVAGGEPCVITGLNFPSPGGEIGPTKVTFGRIEASDIVVVDSETITCTIPAHSAGVVNVRLDCDNGQFTLPSAFTYHNIVGVEPNNGPLTGGTTLTITGSEFTTSEETVVTINGVEALDIQVIDSTTITCQTPPSEDSGPVDVYVANAEGYDTFGDGFNYNDPPSVDSLEPAIGPIAGGTTVTITGSEFTETEDTEVTFGGTAAHDVEVVDATTIVCRSPANPAGVVDVTVTNSNGSSTLPEAFVYQNPPDLIAIVPDNCHYSGGATVTLTGTDFSDVGPTAIHFDGEAATDVTVVSSTEITCVTPPHSPGVVDVVVTNDFGSDTLDNGFTYTPDPDPPSVSSVTPADGKVDGGTAITISGSDFTSTQDTSVVIGSSAGLDVTVVNETTITCTTPAHTAGTVDVTVTNSNGSGTLPGGFTYHEAPDIKSIQPDNGPEGGGTGVTISGSDFTDLGSTHVSVGGVAATNVVVVSTTSITCDTPNHAAGLVDVTVTNDFGSDTLPGSFRFNAAPELSGVEPAHGPAAGGTSVTVSGSDFTSTEDTAVTFGGLEAANVIVVDSSTITCETPAHGAGSVDVVVTNSNGTGILQGGFEFHAPPQIAGVEPVDGPVDGGTAVTVTGSGFTDVGETSVTFGGAAAGNVVVVDGTTLTCTTPAHASGTVDVAVANDFGSATLPGGFTYHAPPAITLVAPSEGPSAGGTAVTITGSDFSLVGETSVAFGGAAAGDVVVVDSTTITCTTPAHAAGAVSVIVTNDFGADTLPDGFTYMSPPEVTDIDPDLGGIAGGTAVTLTGSGFTSTADTTVTFGGSPAANMTVVDSTTITCETPTHAAGAVDVVVTNSYGTHLSPDGFVYYDTPVLGSVTPESGPAEGGTAVTLSGSGFSTFGLTSVTFGGAEAANVSVESETTITCTAPAHAAGVVDVAVSNAFGSDTLEGAYTYIAAPQISNLDPTEGYTTGGTAVTISGSGFTSTADTTVTFGGASAGDVVVVDATTITCSTPARAAGSVDVTVLNSNGSGTLVDGFVYTIEPEINGLAHNRSSNQITLQWQLTAPGDEIVIYRGSEAVDTISGDAESYVYQEDSFGYFRFSVGLFVDGQRVDCDDVLVEQGCAAWDVPQGSVSGFYIYVVEAVGDPYEVLPYDNPFDYSHDAGYCTCLPFKTLYDELLIEDGKSYYLAASSYLIASPEYIVSELTAPLTFSYEVVIGMP